MIMSKIHLKSTEKKVLFEILKAWIACKVWKENLLMGSEKCASDSWIFKVAHEHK